MLRVAALLSLASALLAGSTSFVHAGSSPAAASVHVSWRAWHARLLAANPADPPRPAPARPPAPTTPSAAPAPAEPPPTANWLRSEDGRMSVYVGIYNDPTGQAPVPHGYAVLDLAMSGVRWYFDGHNPGVFTPLLGEGDGSVLDYWDGGGRVHRLRIVAVRSWQRSAGEPPPVSGAVVAQLQTCRTLDGSVDWIYDAVEV
jgi:hypothetical protein